MAETGHCVRRGTVLVVCDTEDYDRLIIAEQFSPPMERIFNMHAGPARCIRSVAIAVSLVFAVVATPAIAVDAETHRLAMDDGVRLATDVYLPDNAEPPFPTIYVSTTYGKSGIKGPAQRFLRQGYAVVAQDIRGMGKSEGDDAIIFHHHGWAKNHDGHDTIRWIASQPWSDGNVGTYGGSALGITQNMLAPDAPKNLKAQHVVVAFSDMYSQCVYQGGALRKQLIEGWLAANRITEGNLDAFLAHPTRDAFWSELSPEQHAEQVNSPGMFVGGWYDIFLQGTINSFTSIHNHGGPGARGKCRLVLGPWAHGTFQELKYPKNSNMGGLEASDDLRFFDYLIKSQDNGTAEDAAVHYYVMGDPTDPEAPGNVWRTADNWPPPAREVPYFFHADTTMSTKKPTSHDSQTYRYNPKDPVPTIGGQNLLLAKGPMDQRKIEQRDDVLLFTTAELSEPLEITGGLKAVLYIASDCPDTDFTVKLSDVYPDGRSMLVTDGILRARYHKTFEQPTLLEPDQVYELQVDLWSTSLVFNRGHRIRIAVSSSNFPRFDANPNTGKPVGDAEPRVANNTIHLSADHPSHIVLPVYVESQSVATKPGG